MYKIVLFLLFQFLFVLKPIVPLGTFSRYNHYDHYALTLNKDSTFVQKNGSCTWAYLAKGKWKLNADTVCLIPQKLYSYSGSGKKTLVDTSSYLYGIFYKMNKVLVNADTLELLYSYFGHSRIIKMTRSKK